jgi:hypothetical protein
VRLTHRRAACWIGATAVTLAVAAPAQADVTASQITTPADPHFALFDADAATQATLAVSGTATGTGNVDIVCTRGASSLPLGGNANNVPVAPDGSFSVADAPLAQIAQPGAAESRACRLHAIPSSSAPSDFTNFPGPRLALSKLARERLSGAGVNDGKLFDFYLYAGGIGFAADYRSFGAYGVYDTMPGDPVSLETLGYGLYGNGYAPDRSSDAPRFYGLTIDGQPAYAPGRLSGGTGGAGIQGNAGYPELSLDPVQFDATNGNVTLAEHDPLVRCAPDPAYPPTIAGCSSFASVPVKLDRTTEHTRYGQVIRVVDRWSSTDGQSHTLDLTMEQDHCFSTDTSNCSAQPVYRFPGETGYAGHAQGTSVPGPLPGAEAILAKDATDPSLGGAGVVPAQSSDGVTFYDQTTQYSGYGLRYAGRVIPATGPLTLTHYYVTGRTPTEAEQLAADVKASLQPAPPSPTGGGTPSGGTPGGGTPTTKPARPKLSRRGGVRTRRKGTTFLVTTGDRVQCPAGGAACVVRVTAKAGKLVVSTARLKLPAGRTVKVAFRLNRKGARALKRKRRLKLTVALSARAGTGTAVTRKRTLTIKAPGKQ